MRKRPRIGITTRLDLEQRRFYLGRHYGEAVEGLGGTPLHIGLIPKRDYIRECLQMIDGVLLPGSATDVDPLRFGEEPHPKLKRVIFEKDETDAMVFEEAEKLNLPVLGICYGMQAINVARGGSLIQDIDSQWENNLQHEQGVPLERNSHSIEIVKGSLLAEIAGGERALVNSHHHQAVKMAGVDLKVTARSKDGIIESIEDARPDKFVLGVQWHPELSWETDKFSRGIFRRFLDACD